MSDDVVPVVFNEPFTFDDDTKVGITIRSPKNYPVGSDMPQEIIDKAIVAISSQKYNIGDNPIPTFQGYRICFALVS